MECTLASFPSRRAPRRTSLTIVALVALLSTPLIAISPPRGTLRAWGLYVKATEARIAGELGDSARPLVIDRQPEGVRGRERAAVLAGTIPVAEMPAALADGKPIDIPDGRIHHWRGAVFIPRLTVSRLLDIVQGDPGEHKQPDVTRARMIARDGDHLRLFLQIQRTQIITVTYNTEHDLHYVRLREGFATSRAEATRIVEVADPGTPREREKPDGDDHGFLWGLNAYWRYLQVGDGVIVECESVSLSRGIPLLARPVVSPIVDHIAAESMRRTLDALRTRVRTAMSGASVGR